MLKKMETSKDIFKKGLVNNYTSNLGGEQTQNMMMDMNRYSKEMRENENIEDEDDKKNDPNTSEIPKVTSKQQFMKDLQSDKDYLEFKKNSKYIKGGAQFTYGTPNVTKDDPYINKKTKYGRPGRGKEESNEATGSGSSGGYVGPVAFMDSDFVKKSFKETPGKIKESSGETSEETTEATTSGSVGGYESPAMWAKSTKKKDWGPSRKTQYPGGAFVKVKKKCTKFPYCNQGDINALNITKNESVAEAIKNVSKKHNISEYVIKTILEFEYSKIKR